MYIYYDKLHLKFECDLKMYRVQHPSYANKTLIGISTDFKQNHTYIQAPIASDLRSSFEPDRVFYKY